MPFIKVSLNQTLSQEEKVALKAGFGRLIPLLHKSEPWLMVGFYDKEKSLWFQGKEDPAAIVEIACYGRIDPSSYDPMTRETTKLLSSITKIPSNRIYVNYQEYAHWGWSGENF